METGASAFAGGAAADEIDRLLRVSNIEYESKRKSGRLVPLRVRLLPNGAGGRYRERCVASGQRDAQFKYLHLQYARDCAFDFDAIAVAGVRLLRIECLDVFGFPVPFKAVFPPRVGESLPRREPHRRRALE